MSVLFPGALVGLIAAVTPVVAYLLLRRRKTEMPWGASYLLRLTLTSKRRSSIWKQLVVLACRCAMLALIAVLIARLVRPNPAPANLIPKHPDQPVHRVVLYDNSLSMTAEQPGQPSRQMQATAAIEQLLGSQQPGDIATLIALVPKSVPPMEIRGRARGETLTQWREASALPVQGDVDLDQALTEACVRLSLTPASAGEVYIFSDFPRELASTAEKLGWLAQVRDKRSLRLVPVNVAGNPEKAPANVVLESMTTGTDLVLAGLPVTVYVEAVNYSDQEATANLIASVDGEAVQSSRVAFKPNERKSVPLTVKLTKPGDALLEVTTDSSRLPGHSSRALSLDVRKELTVWVIGDDSDLGPNEIRDSDFLYRGLENPADSLPKVTLDSKTLGDLGQAIPAEVDVVLLAAPGFASPAAQTQLMDFVQRGGGLILTAGPTVQVTSYNDSYPELLPAPLGPPARGEIDPATFDAARTELSSGASPLFRDLASERGGDFSEVRFYNYQQVDEGQLAGEVVMRLGNDAPLLLHRRLGRGHVYLFTSTVGIGWTSLPVRQAYLPFLYRLLEAASRERTFARNLSVGERLVMMWPSPGEVTLESPQGQVTTLKTAPWQERQVVVAEGLNEPGLYRLSGGGHRSTATVSGGGAEGDLRFLTGEQRASLEAALGAPVHGGWQAAVRALGAADAVQAGWPYLVLAMLAVYLFEIWFVRKL